MLWMMAVEISFKMKCRGRDQPMFAAELQRIVAANSLQICCLRNEKVEGLRHRRRDFAADSLQMQRKAPVSPRSPELDELQAAAWNRPFHWPPRPRQKRIAEATVAAV